MTTDRQAVSEPARVRGDRVPSSHREVRLAARPDGRLHDGNFAVVEAPVQVAGPGEVLVRNHVMAVSAPLRSLMNERSPLPLPPMALGEPMLARAIREVIAFPDDGPCGW